ncbi:MAG TPA: ferritin-like protein [Mycobacterium sp.]|nr:ferritin-like protein [Mycobacterium sp.]
MPEPEIVVANREHLWWLLAEAAQLEHMIMCQYLFAEFSLKSADELTAEQAEVVDRWRKTLRGIAVEEMLHLALVANLMAAIGAAPTFGRPNFPRRSGYFPAAVQLDLLPFGEQALRHFLYLERPEGMQRQDAEGFVPTALPLDPLDAAEAMPHGQEFATVGHLYRGIERGLATLADRIGERALFVGSPRAQATPQLFRWPQLISVTDLATAQAAVDEIIEQGEGARGDWQHAHYGRFLGMWQDYADLRRSDPSFEPTRPVLPAYSRQPFDVTDPVPVITDPHTRRVAELAALGYELVLHLLTRFFTHTDETDQQLDVLVNCAIDTMAGVLRPLATTLTTLPIGPEHPAHTAGFSFEMFYAMGNLVPWREPAWALLHERASILADRCAEVLDDTASAHDHAAATAAGLATHVPADLQADPQARN